ncbi:Complexin-1 [Channa argus]|uniref:Complexin-1 n=1 Tax=Channa argus TaxID=215402 RepID=A0A6G1PVQ7_CHAAH|nr:Complexin-1 [Channa argus]
MTWRVGSAFYLCSYIIMGLDALGTIELNSAWLTVTLERPSVVNSLRLVLQGATKDMGKMLGGEEEKDPDAQKKEEERQEALRQQEEERKAKYARMEAERENLRQGIRDKYGIKKKEEKEAEAAAAMEQASEGSLTRPKKAVPTGCGDEEEEESIVDTVMKFIPAPLMDMFNKK